MVHPKVLENCAYDSERYYGFAFGLGIERVAILKYAIPGHAAADSKATFGSSSGSGPRDARPARRGSAEFAPTDLERRATRGDADPAEAC